MSSQCMLFIGRERIFHLHSSQLLLFDLLFLGRILSCLQFEQKPPLRLSYSHSPPPAVQSRPCTPGSRPMGRHRSEHVTRWCHDIWFVSPGCSECYFAWNLCKQHVRRGIRSLSLADDLLLKLFHCGSKFTVQASARV